MESWFNLQHRLKNLWLLLFVVFLFFYFAYFTINGDRGLLRYIYLNKEISHAQKTFEEFHSQKLALESKVKMLSSSSLDVDMLEERARAVLNYVGDGEVIVLDESANSPKP